jgi:hypothetical protein
MCQKTTDFYAYIATLRLFGIGFAVSASSVEKKIHFLAVVAYEIEGGNILL